ncbi:flagellar basal body L-ring protein FlgH [Acidisoma silvae]|uniref:Flagellar basal body L-ring protein FlgH n=1 Tax=Acidisoma silvae TaxID=2802396 RepID=A0A964DYD8_9PROT|nr:flagellar basal body L-ring protein FlgH [Acidisoma silvae]MCB8874904.1 flagellar basal body L-ring protein FlgH [Acidisoma silvae]
MTKRAICGSQSLCLVLCLLLDGCATQAPSSRSLVPETEFPIAVPRGPLAENGSIFPPNSSGSIYEPKRDWRPGDLVAIDIVTTTAASNNDATSLSRAGTVSNSVTSFFGVPLNIGSLAGTPFSPTITTASANKYTGSGTEAASNTVSGQIEAVVTRVDPNGTLALEGRTNVNVNGNVTALVVTGYASPQDITANATISSNNVAGMNVQYVGNGPINDSHQVPLLQQVLDKIWPF